jgi:hypothetical protein
MQAAWMWLHHAFPPLSLSITLSSLSPSFLLVNQPFESTIKIVENYF